MNIYSLYCSPHISYGADKENLFNNRELLKLVIISFILMILVNDLAVLLQGEIRCWSLLGFKRVKKKSDIVKCKCLDTKLKTLTNIFFPN